MFEAPIVVQICVFYDYTVCSKVLAKMLKVHSFLNFNILLASKIGSIVLGIIPNKIKIKTF